MLPRRSTPPQRIKLNTERLTHWLGVGARPSDRVAKFLAGAELMRPRVRREQTKKPLPKAKGAGARQGRGRGGGQDGEAARAVLRVCPGWCCHPERSEGSRVGLDPTAGLGMTGDVG